MCGMTRAMICDPEMANKAKARQVRRHPRLHRLQSGVHRPFSAGPADLLHPASRRPDVSWPSAEKRRRDAAQEGDGCRGGPAGLKAAACAAERGHDVTLYESDSRLGGQANLAQLIPGRAEFGGIIQNLSREAERAGVRILKSAPVDSSAGCSRAARRVDPGDWLATEDADDRGGRQGHEYRARRRRARGPGENRIAGRRV